jgi:predicted RNA binding protein with dsRBD fold (UPF0201 family)
MDEVNVHIEAEVNPTESEDKVKKTIENIFGSLALETRPSQKGKLIIADARGKETLTYLRNLLRRERIRTAARAALLKGLDVKTICFYLNKQVAFAGHISFAMEVGESPLGPIKIKIRCEDPRELVEWLTSETR